MKTTPDPTANDLMSTEEVRGLLPGRWRSPQSLAAASRRGSGPPGRVLLGPSRAAYDRREVLAWLAAEAARETERLATLRERARIAREALARRRAAAVANIDDPV